MENNSQAAAIEHASPVRPWRVRLVLVVRERASIGYHRDSVELMKRSVRTNGWMRHGFLAGVLANVGLLTLLAVWPDCVGAAETMHESARSSEWHKAAIHGHTIYYAVRGSGPTLVFLHGGGDSGEHSFVRQLEVFSEHHHIVAPDQVGQGRTPDVHGPLSYTAMMDDTAELLKMLRLSHVDVVGFSDGGILALMLAVRHPELVRRLVISGVNIAPEGLRPEDLAELRANQIPKPRTIDEKLAQLWATSPTEEELNLSLLAKITAPVLLISGDRDAITLEHTLTIFHALPDAELCVLPGTDHATFSGRSDWLNPIISAFLDRAPSAASASPGH